MDRKALIGLLSGVTVVIATLIGVALVNTREAEGADGSKVAIHDCGIAKKAAEPGYGVNPPQEACTRN